MDAALVVRVRVDGYHEGLGKGRGRSWAGQGS